MNMGIAMTHSEEPLAPHDRDSGINRRRFLQASASGLLAARLLLSPEANASGKLQDRPVVQVEHGRLRGVSVSGVKIFKGVPYAGGAEGANRFLPPTPVQPWSGIRDADALGPPAMQAVSGTEGWLDPRFYGGQAENCQFLNVWSPEGASGKTPVMVFFHPGTTGQGSGGVVTWDGANLAKRGNVIIVTVNYRLNVFGYMYLGGLSTDDKYATGNAGHLDCIAALKWVRNNIAAFGGDPNVVTAWGMSGGGAAVATLLAMPETKGLIHRAIQSSGTHLSAAHRGVGTHAATVLMEKLGLKPGQVERLQKLPANDLKRALLDVTDGGGYMRGFEVVVDGRSLPRQLDHPESQAISADVPLLVGSALHESVPGASVAEAGPWGMIVGDKQWNMMLWDDEQLRFHVMKQSGRYASLGNERVDALIQGYRNALPGASRLEIFYRLGSDASHWIAAITQAERKVALGKAPAYLYSFDWRTPVAGGLWAPHANDFRVAFDNMHIDLLLDDRDTGEARAKADPKNLRYRVRDRMVEAWSAFAHTGSPATKNLAWQPYNLQSRPTMIFDAESRMENDPRRWSRDLLTADLMPEITTSEGFGH